MKQIKLFVILAFVSACCVTITQQVFARPNAANAAASESANSGNKPVKPKFKQTGDNHKYDGQSGNNRKIARHDRPSDSNKPRVSNRGSQRSEIHNRTGNDGNQRNGMYRRTGKRGSPRNGMYSRRGNGGYNMGTNDGDQESKLYSQDLNNGDPKSEMRDQDSNDDAPQSGMHDQGSEQENSYDGNTASYDSYEPVPDEDTYTEYKDQSGYPAYDNRHPALNRTLSPGTTSVFSFMESLKSNQANQADQ